MITTNDNPFDPFTHFDEWYQFDTEKGYDSCSYLARIAQVSSEMTPELVDDEIEAAIDEIIALNPLKIYKKVERKGKKDL